METQDEQEKPGKPKKSGCVIAVIIAVVVAVLLGIVLVFLVAAYFQLKPGDADKLRAEADLKALEASLIRYKVSSRVYPTTEQGLDALVQKPAEAPIPEKWRQLIDSRGLRDPWGEPYRYRIPGVHNPDGYDVWSAGPDGQDGTSDDISAE